MARQTANDVYMIGRTGYRLTVLNYQENEKPIVIVDVHDPSGTIVDRAVITVPIINGQQPKLDIVRTDTVVKEPEDEIDNG